MKIGGGGGGGGGTTDLTTVNSRLDALEAKDVTQDATDSTQNTNISTNATNITSVSSRVTTLEGQNLNSRLTTAEGNITTNTSNISTNTSNISSQNTRITALEGGSSVTAANVLAALVGSAIVAATLSLSGALTANGVTTTTLSASNTTTLTGNLSASGSTNTIGGTSSTTTVQGSTVTVGYDASSSVGFTNGPSGINRYDGKHVEFSDEMMFRTALVSGVANDWWTCISSGTGAACGQSNPTAVAGHPGVQRFTTGTTSTGRAQALTATTSITPTDGTFVNHAAWRLASLSTSTDGFGVFDGFGDTDTAFAQANGCFLANDERNVLGFNASNSNNLIAVCCKASVCAGYPLDGTTSCDGGFTSVATAVSASTWITDEVRMSPSLVEFYADTGSGLTKRCQITNSANIPTAAVGWMTGIFKSVGTTAKILDLDYIQLRWDLLTARH